MFTPFAFVKQAAAAGGGFGPLTTAFIAATGITGSVLQNALNDFETGLTTYSLTSKLSVCYPFVGGNSTTMKYNFMNTSQYQITFNGSINYYSNGIQTPDGTGYADTGIAASSISVSEGHHFQWIVTNESPGDNGSSNYPAEWGCTGDPSNPNLSQYYANIWALNGLELAWPCNNATGQGNGSINASNSSANGYWCSSRTSASSLVLYKNASSFGSNTNTLTGRSYSSGLGNYGILARTNNSISPRRAGFVTIGLGSGTGLDSTDQSNLYTLVTTFNTAIGR